MTDAEDIRRTALKFIQSSFIDSGEIKTNSANDPDEWERPSSSQVNLHDILNDLELKTNVLLRAEKGWRVVKLILKEGAEFPRHLVHVQPYYIRPRGNVIEVYFVINESLGRIK